MHRRLLGSGPSRGAVGSGVALRVGVVGVGGCPAGGLVRGARAKRDLAPCRLAPGARHWRSHDGGLPDGAGGVPPGASDAGGTSARVGYRPGDRLGRVAVARAHWRVAAHGGGGGDPRGSSADRVQVVPSRESGRVDLNHRPHGPEPCALTWLSYAPTEPPLAAE